MRKHIWFLCASCLIAIILGLLTLSGSRTAFGIISLIFLALLLGGMVYRFGLEKIDKYMLYFVVLSIPFPYLLQFSGRDALTVTTIMIYFLFIITILRHLFERKSLTMEPKFIFILPILIFTSMTVSLILNPSFMGQSIRYYIANISGILLYFIILATIRDHSDVRTVIKVILFTLVVQSGIVLLVYKFPTATEYLAVFSPRVPVSEVSVYEGMHRSIGTVWDYELLAEWFLVGSILSIGLFYHFKKNVYIFSLFCCLAGIIFTVTRSAFFLLIFGLALILTLVNILKKDSKWSTIKIVLLLFLTCIILFGVFPKQIDSLTRRLEVYFRYSDLLSPEAINRGKIWQDAFRIFLREPTIFGKGLYNVSSLYYSADSFHSLYLTILYKIGILGLLIHLAFWLKMLFESWRILVAKNKNDNWYVLFFLFVSVILILIDGIKIEYLRYGHTIQFAWLIYGLLNISIKQSRENNENIMVSKTPV
ncbi:MAG: O-antigen ligase family protein [Candidatus Omnitrophica bacterium]|nr:O-antigen ligase family protein [Candidatus Omnitrophota bacterium]MBU4590679.1 O-antigen ligase family protein [Candidatus Omnitrophota bacterium]